MGRRPNIPGYWFGMFIDILRAVEASLGFESNITYPEHAQGSWVVLYNDTANGLNDMSIAGFNKNYDNSRTDQTWPMGTVRSSFIYRRRDAATVVNYMVYMDIFTVNAWWFITVALCLLILFMSFALSGDYVGKFLESVAVVFCSIVQLSSDSRMATLQAKIVFLSLSALSIVLFASYTAVLTSEMTVTDSPQPISDFEGVLE